MHMLIASFFNFSISALNVGFFVANPNPYSAGCAVFSAGLGFVCLAAHVTGKR